MDFSTSKAGDDLVTPRRSCAYATAVKRLDEKINVFWGPLKHFDFRDKGSTVIRLVCIQECVGAINECLYLLIET